MLMARSSDMPEARSGGDCAVMHVVSESAAASPQQRDDVDDDEVFGQKRPQQQRRRRCRDAYYIALPRHHAIIERERRGTNKRTTCTELRAVQSRRMELQCFARCLCANDRTRRRCVCSSRLCDARAEY